MSNSASSASSSSPPVIPMDSLLRKSMSNTARSASSSSRPNIPMDPRLQQLLKACSKGDVNLCINLIDANPDILLSTTPHKNNCLHIAAMLGLHKFAEQVWLRAPSLFSETNIDGETPLIAALMAANISLASNIVTNMPNDNLEEGRSLKRMLLNVDINGANALHHALRNGFKDFAVRLLDIEPQLSKQVSETEESPMYMAARRGYNEVVEQLLQIPSSANSGPNDESAFHAAVRFNNKGIVEQLLEGRPHLAFCQDRSGSTPLVTAAICNNLELVKIFLEYDPNLAYIKSPTTGDTLFTLTAKLGYVSIAEEIVRSCPDSVYISDNHGNGALHIAVANGQLNFVNYILGTPQLRCLINKTNNIGSLPLHFAAHFCEPKIIRSLLAHAELDYTAINSNSMDAVDAAVSKRTSDKTLKWNESLTLLTKNHFGPKDFLTMEAKKDMKEKAIEEVKSLTAKYTSNTSLIAALLATITFAAAFTLPGGFSSDPADMGLPIFARKTAFQVFIISDTIAMCSSLVVAFLCILTTWEDLDFLLNYRKTTRALMWCAYGATALAFGTGLFTVIAPNHLWLAILILVLCAILPLLSKIIGEWPLLMLRYRLGGLFRKDLIPNI